MPRGGAAARRAPVARSARDSGRQPATQGETVRVARRRFDRSIALLSALAALPVLALGALGAGAIFDARREVSRATDDTALAELDTALAAVVDALQVERGLAFLLTRGVAPPESTTAVEERSDAALAALGAVSSRLAGPAREVVDPLLSTAGGELAAARTTAAPEVQFDRYTALVERAVEASTRAAATSHDTARLRSMTALAFVEEFIDAAGQERAIVGAVVARGQPMPATTRDRWERLVSRQERALGRAAVPRSLEELLTTLRESAAFTAVADARDLVRQGAPTGVYAIDPVEWFERTSARVEAVSTLAAAERAELVAAADDDAGDARRRAWIAGSGLVVLVGGALVLQVALVREVRNRRAAEARSAALVGEMQATLLQLEAAASDLERFAFVAAHDLRSSLRHVASFSDLHARELLATGAEPSARAEEFRDYVRRGIRRMDELLEDILTYTSLRDARLRLVEVDLDDALDELLTELAPTMPSDAVVVVDHLPTVPGDERLLRLALGNLLQNAVKYRRPGVPLELAVDAAHQQGTWRIRVADNGLGIPAEYQDRIFQLFRRLHGPEEYEGTGLGLAIAARIAALHGGTVEVASVEGEGSTFTLVLPAATAATETAPPAGAPERVEPGGGEATSP
jgi:signal transduction histidine kinase